jgi:hypothetical protein
VQFVEALGRCELVADSASQLSLDVDMFHVAAYYRCALRRLLPHLETIDEIAVSEFVDPDDISVGASEKTAYSRGFRNTFFAFQT